MLRDKLSPGTKPGFLKSEKMLRFKLLYTHKSVSENVYVNNIIIYGWCYSIILTHVIYGWCYCHLGDINPHFNFLLLQAGVIAFYFSFCWQLLLPIVSGRCYITEADVIAYCILYHFMADVITIICGRCYYHFISTPFQPLANPPTCIAALYAKSKASITSKCSLQLCKTTTTALPTQITPDVWIITTPATAPTDTISLICPEKPMETIAIWQPLHVLKLPTVCSATSAHFFLPPRYETPILNTNISLDMANLQAVNLTALHFRVWQHMGRNHSETQLQYLATIPSIPVHKVYQHLLNSSLHLTPFNMKPSEDMDTLWNLFTHPGIYISALGSLIPLQSGNMWYSIVDVNVEEAPIYRCEG